ncbi:hypothetical protein [Lentzea aerocolonigenes]|uniref:hypothetical protein n=1 Tax=Lentzea aerocolonigenes TaxID=68170 RepID=UPI0005EC58E1|nr:hypothetical protein [Lentzea aerocolonigenes]
MTRLAPAGQGAVGSAAAVFAGSATVRPATAVLAGPAAARPATAGLTPLLVAVHSEAVIPK